MKAALSLKLKFHKRKNSFIPYLLDGDVSYDLVKKKLSLLQRLWCTNSQRDFFFSPLTAAAR